MHRVWYKCQTIHERGNSGDLREKYKHQNHELENLGEIHDKQKHEIQEIGYLGEFMKKKTSLHSERRRRLCIFEDLLQNPQLAPKYPETVLFAKRS